MIVNGKLINWRENLGHDKIIAQYRARAMFWVWFNHVGDAAKAHRIAGDDLAPFVLPPLDRNAAKAKAWHEVERLVTAPAKQAARFNATNETPTHKLVAVPVSVPDERAASVALAEEKPPAPRNTSILTLHRGADRWLANLRKRMERGDLSSEYYDRADVSMKRLKELTQDYPLGDIAKPELDEIRIAIQANRNGKTLKRPTVKTELGHIKTMLLWLDGNELWPSPPRRWEKWLRPIFRNDDTDDDAGSDKQHDTYTLEELGKLYTHAGYSMRLWILCALNFGWGQKEIATARKTHWKTAEPDKRRVARYRHKRVPGSDPVPGR